MQVVRAGPHVGEDQRPEVHDRQAIRVNRTLGLLRNKVIHHAQEAGGQEETDRVMPVPPLNHRVLHTGICRVGLHQTGRDRRAVDQMQQGYGNDESTEEPIRNVNVAHLACADGAKEHHGERNPDHGDQDIDRPFEFGVFLALRVTQRQRDGRRQNDQLPTPEGEGGEFVTE